jgi:hypothetical protein
MCDAIAFRSFSVGDHCVQITDSIKRSRTHIFTSNIGAPNYGCSKLRRRLVVLWSLFACHLGRQALDDRQKVMKTTEWQREEGHR